MEEISRSWLTNGVGRVILIGLKRGDCLLESIRDELSRKDIKNAILTGAIGSLSKVVLHRVTGFEEKPVDEFITLDKPMELASLQGIVLDGQPHFHLTVSDVEQTYTGHLEEGTTVLYLAEISLLEIMDVNLTRVKGENGISFIAPKR